MAKTKIEWADFSWNPWYGCHKVSQGCKHCYMFREQKMYGRDPDVVVRSKTQFDWPLRWVKKVRAGQAKAGRVFTCSWSDWFIEEADPIRDLAWEIIRRTPEMTYMILTKRPERMAACLPYDWESGWGNVWLGVSCEDQDTLLERMPFLSIVPAGVKFVSCEPLLGPISFMGWLDYIDWVIVGGESGPGARVMEEKWVQGIRHQCRSAGKSFFFKQWGGLKPGGEALMDGREWKEFPR